MWTTFCNTGNVSLDEYSLSGYKSGVAKLSAQFRMADRLAGGRLAEIISDGRQDGQSLDHIARRLYAEHGIEVTRQTVANWSDALGIEPLPEAAGQ